MQKIWTNKRISTLILFIFLAIYQTVVMATEEPIVPDCLLKAPHTPVFEVRDTVNKYGRYSKVTKTKPLRLNPPILTAFKPYSGTMRGYWSIALGRKLHNCW